MEDKRGIKCSHSPSKEGFSSPSNGSTPPPHPSGYPPPPGSPLEVSSCRPRPSVLKEGGPSEKIPVVDPSSDEEDLIPNITRDAEFAKNLFGDLNRERIGPLDNSKIIILNDSKEEVREEDTADAKTASSSAVKSPAPTASAVDADDANKGHTPDQVIGDSSSRDGAGSP
jgi:hypothetical protein